MPCEDTKETNVTALREPAHDVAAGLKYPCQQDFYVEGEPEEPSPETDEDDPGSPVHESQAEREARVFAAAVLGGTPGHSTPLPATLSLLRLSRAPAPRLQLELGLDREGARRISAAFALGRCAERARTERGAPMNSPERVHGLMAPILRGLEKENFHVLLLDGKHRYVRHERVSEGILTTSLVHPREVFRPALFAAAAAIIAVHNHPSGDPEPSREDLEVTRRLQDAGKLLGIPVLDHVIVGDGCFVSLRQRMGFG